MNPTSILEVKNILSSTKKTSKELKHTEVVVCPPFPFVHLVKPESKINVFGGVQDVFWQPAGSFTGEVSSEMVRSFGISYTILGHSERRAQGETDEMVSKKANSALNAGFKVIICVGEKTRDASGEYLEFLRNQLIQSLAGVKKKYASDVIVAYEPVFAIGKSFAEAMQPQDIHETTLFLKKVLLGIFGKEWSSAVKILYGGSVNFENADLIVGGGEVDGLLVGRESLNTDTFPKLLKVVDGIPL